MRCFRRTQLARLRMFTLGVLALVAVAHGSPIVTIHSGKLEGTADGKIDVFLGVPFAAPPVEELRWRAPQAVSTWSGTRAATRFAASCPQALSTSTQLAPIVETAEDCLYLNVWAPRSHAPAKKPVMVWLHGGGFIAGSGAEREFDGSNFARRGIVLVTINYRIGRLGFFAHPALDRQHPAEAHGNYGLLDQLAALKWVQENIKDFGGDPRNVTVFGESAGAMSIVYLSTSPLAKGLFAKEIIQSGSIRRPIPDIAAEHPGLPSAETAGKDWATSRGITTDDQIAVAALRALPVELVAPSAPELPEVMAILNASQPMVDGLLLPDDPNLAFDQPGLIRVPMIVGSNGRENRVWEFGKGLGTITIAPLFVPDFVHKLDERDRTVFLDAYRSEGMVSDGQIEEAASSDAILGAGSWALVNVATKDTPAYLYRFDAVPGPGRTTIDLAPHGTEIFYVFGTLSAFRYRPDLVTDSDRALSEAVMDYWTSFARGGVPVSKSGVAWPRFDAQANVLLSLSNRGVRVTGIPRLGAIRLISEHPVH